MSFKCGSLSGRGHHAPVSFCYSIDVFYHSTRMKDLSYPKRLFVFVCFPIEILIKTFWFSWVQVKVKRENPFCFLPFFLFLFVISETNYCLVNKISFLFSSCIHRHHPFFPACVNKVKGFYCFAWGNRAFTKVSQRHQSFVSVLRKCCTHFFHRCFLVWMLNN